MLVKVPTQVLALLALSGLLYSVDADLQITNPVRGAEWNSGDTVRITWTIRGKAAKVTDLWLQYGKAVDLNEGIRIVEAAKVEALSYEWKVPDVYTRDDYTVRIGTGLPNDDINYSHPFSIEGKGEPPSEDEAEEGTETIPKKAPEDAAEEDEEGGEEGSEGSGGNGGEEGSEDPETADGAASPDSGSGTAPADENANSPNGAASIFGSRISAFAGAAIVLVAMTFC